MRRANGASDTAKAVLLALALVAVVLAIRDGLLRSIGDNGSFAFTLAGSFAFYLATRPARSAIAVTLLLGLALRLAYGATIGVQPYFGSPLICSAGFLGLASLLVLAYSGLRNNRFAPFGYAAFLPFMSIMVGFILPLGIRFCPVAYDTHLLAADGTLGFQPSFVLGRLAAERPALWNFASTVYYALPFAVALLCAARFKEHPSQARRLFYLFALLSIVGFALYTLCPATGPMYAFRDVYPWNPPSLRDLALGLALSVPGAPRNAMPSLHFSSALLVLWNTSGLGKAARIAATLFVAAMAFAVLAVGEHYLIDLIVAVPFSLMIQAVLTSSLPGSSRPRYLAMSSGAALAVGWCLLLRYWIGPLVAWPAVARAAFLATLGFSIWARYALLPANHSRLSETAQHL